MDETRVVRLLFVGYVLAVFAIRAAGGGDAFPTIYGIQTINLAVFIGLVLLIFGQLYVSRSRSNP